jgi:hypothetical protein
MKYGNYPRSATLNISKHVQLRLRRLTLAVCMLATAAASYAAQIVISAGWNLVGNSQSLPMNVADYFGAANVTTVWKWDAANAKWQFYTPTMSASGLQAYAAGNGYDVLTAINAGEGVWVNATSSFSATLPSGVPITNYSFSIGQANALQDGWNLVSTGTTITPGSFNFNLDTAPPVAGVISNNFTSLWAWDNAMSSWYYYAPLLESQGRAVASNYIASKGFLDFVASGKTLGAGMGFWVARGLTIDAQPPSPGASLSTTTTTATSTTTTSTAPMTTTTVASTTTTSLVGTGATCQVAIGSAVGYVTGVPTSGYCTSSLLNANGGGATVTIASLPLIAGRTQLNWTSLNTCDLLGAPPSAGATTLTPCAMAGTTTTTTTTTAAPTTTTTVASTTTTTLVGNGVTCKVAVGSAIGYVNGVPTSGYCVNSMLDTDGGGAIVTTASPPLLTGKTQLGWAALLTCDPFGAPPAAGAVTLTPCAKGGTPPSSAGTQSVTFGSAPTLAVSGAGTVTATGGTSGNAVTFSSNTPLVCTVAGSTVTALAAGNCVVAANQAGNANYSAAAQATQTIVVSAGTQSLSFGSTPTLTFGGNGTVSATGGASGNAVTFNSNTPLICTVAGSTVTALAVGNCVIAAYQAGNANYTAAPQATQIIAISAGAQSVSFGSSPTLAVGGTGTVMAAGGASGNAVTFTAIKPLICTVGGTNGSTITALAAGSCVIAANQAGNANYAAAPQVTQIISVNPGQQTISFGPTPILVVDGTGLLSAAGGASGNAVVFTSTTPALCKVSGNTVTGVMAGDCVIAANQTGNANYATAVQITQRLSVLPGSQRITFGIAPVLAAYDTSLVNATGGATGYAVVFTSNTPSTCSVLGRSLTALKAGICTVAANQAGNANYQAAPQATQDITIGNASLQILKGWNLAGNTTDLPIVVSEMFTDIAVVTSVWKWDATARGWQFYSPNLTATELEAYAKVKGYGVLTLVNPGDGFWIDAKITSSLGALAGAFYSLPREQLINGWNLVATAADVSPAKYNQSLLATPPAPGVTPINLTSLWAWDNPQGKWYFYSPKLEGLAGTALSDYISGKGYLDFNVYSKTLNSGMGFWVDKPASIQ